MNKVISFVLGAVVLFGALATSTPAVYASAAASDRNWHHHRRHHHHHYRSWGHTRRVPSAASLRKQSW